MDILVGGIIFFSLIVAAVVIGPTVKMAVDIAPFLYTNTRCSARSGNILRRKTYDSLLATTYIKEVYAHLEDTAYSRVVEHGNQFGTISPLLEKDLFEMYTWLENIMPEKLKRIIVAMKAKFEINEIKESINRLKNGEPVGDLIFMENPNMKLKLEASTDIASFSSSLEGTPYGKVVNGGPVPSINTDLDRYYFEHVLQEIDECKDQKAATPFKEYWRRVIDLANIRLALRRIAEKGEGPSLVQGGYIPVEKLAGVSDKNQLSEALQETPYAEISTDQQGMKLEQEFLTFISQEGGRANAKFPLKGGPIVRFIIQKELEVRNLNILLKLKAENFDAEKINEYLVI